MPCVILWGSMFSWSWFIFFVWLRVKKPKQKITATKKIANDENVQFYENPRNIKSTLMGLIRLATNKKLLIFKIMKFWVKMQNRILTRLNKIDKCFNLHPLWQKYFLKLMKMNLSFKIRIPFKTMMSYKMKRKM